MITENVPVLKIHKLTQKQFEKAFQEENIEENAIYLTPEIVPDVIVKQFEDGTEVSFINFGGTQNIKTFQISNKDAVVALNPIKSVAITEDVDGSVTMVNTLEEGTETIVVGADANGNPSKLTYNGVEIPIIWAVNE